MKSYRDDQRKLRKAIRLIYLLRPDMLCEARSELGTRSKLGEGLRQSLGFGDSTIRSEEPT